MPEALHSDKRARSARKGSARINGLPERKRSHAHTHRSARTHTRTNNAHAKAALANASLERPRSQKRIGPHNRTACKSLPAISAPAIGRGNWIAQEIEGAFRPDSARNSPGLGPESARTRPAIKGTASKATVKGAASKATVKGAVLAAAALEVLSTHSVRRAC